MRNGRAPLTAASRFLSTKTSRTPPPPPPPPPLPPPPPPHPPTSVLQDLLAAASISRCLFRQGTPLPSSSYPSVSTIISDPVVLRLLRRPSLTPSAKLDFFRYAVSLPHYSPSPSAYAELFRALCSSRAHLDHLLPLLRHALTSTLGSSAILPSTFNLILDSLLRNARFDAAIDALDELREAGGSPTLRVYSSIVLALLNKSQYILSLSIFRKILEGPAIPLPSTCNAMLVGLKRAGMRDEFRKVFDELALKGFPSDTWGFNICIHAFGYWGDLDAALRLFKEMKTRETPHAVPDLCTYNSLIRVLCMGGKVQDALIAYGELKEFGQGPDVFTYRTLIQSCCKTHRICDATRIFSEMELNNVSPDIVIYNSLLDGFFKARKLKDACELFERMVADSVRMSCYSYNILIDGLFKNERIEAAYTLFCDLKKKGQFVDGVTYSIVISQLCREGEVEEALELVEEMEAKGLVVDLVTVTAVLVALHETRRWDWAESLMRCVRSTSIIPNVLRWTQEMEASFREAQDKSKDFRPMFPCAGSFNDVMKWVNPASEEDTENNHSNYFKFKDEWSLSPYMDHLAEKSGLSENLKLFSVHKGKRVQDRGERSFDVDMVNTYMSIFLGKGKISLACKLFEIFTESMGHGPVVYTYNSLLSSLVKKGYLGQAWGLLQKMAENLCPADVATYNAIIRGLGKIDEAGVTSNVVEKLLKKGGYLDPVMYNTLIHTLGKAGRLDEANGVFKQMTESGINPDVVTFNILIEIHAKAGKIKPAYQFLRMMLDAGCSPNHVTDTILDFLEKEIEKTRYQKASIKRNKDESNLDS